MSEERVTAHTGTLLRIIEHDLVYGDMGSASEFIELAGAGDGAGDEYREDFTSLCKRRAADGGFAHKGGAVAAAFLAFFLG
jgi:hypothetical protein